MCKVELATLDSIRIKITDRCPWNCWWCHNEGTGQRDPKRVADIYLDEELANILDWLRDNLGFSTIHFSGGEPSSHPQLVELIEGLRTKNFRLKVTTIGFAPQQVVKYYEAGLRSFNFSVHAIDPDLLHKTQVDRSLEWTKRQLDQQLECILEAKRIGAKAKINCVMVNKSDEPRVNAVMDWALQNQIPFRVMNELSSGEESIEAISNMFNRLGAKEEKRAFFMGSSSYTSYFSLPSGAEVGFKNIRELFLNSMCLKCPLYGHKCHEKFYGVRLEKILTGGGWRYFIRLCLHRSTEDTVMPFLNFIESAQYRELRSTLLLQSGKNEWYPQETQNKESHKTRGPLRQVFNSQSLGVQSGVTF